MQQCGAWLRGKVEPVFSLGDLYCGWEDMCWELYETERVKRWRLSDFLKPNALIVDECTQHDEMDGVSCAETAAS